MFILQKLVKPIEMGRSSKDVKGVQIYTTKAFATPLFYVNCILTNPIWRP